MNDLVESYRKHRPNSFVEVLGQEAAISQLIGLLESNKFPHAVLLSGPSGVGKTTCARILKDKLGCAEIDYHELNAAADRGIDTVRDLRSCLHQGPLGGRSKVWCLDEVHHFTKKSDGDAQTALLKVLEDVPDHVYFFLCTTHPEQLLSTVRGRCTPIRFRAVPDDALMSLLRYVSKKEEVKFTKEEARAVVECAEGSAREALALFDSLKSLPEGERLQALADKDSKAQALELCKLLMDPRSKWPEVGYLLQKLDDEPETIRRAVLGFANKRLLEGTKPDRAYLILCCFESNFFDSGKAGLTRACFEVYRDKGD